MYLFPVLFYSLIFISKVLNTVSIIVLILILIYFIYQIILYTQSRFYKYMQINIFEAIYNGFLDFHVAYDSIDRISDVKDLNLDLQKRIITFSRKDKYYCILFQEMFGKIDAKSTNEMWVQLSKPGKSFGKKYFQKKLKFSNPIRTLDEYIDELNLRTSKKYTGFLVLTGFYRMDFTDDKIIAPYEISSVIK